MRIDGNNTRVEAGGNTDRVAGQRADEKQDAVHAERPKIATNADQAVLTPRAREVRTALRALEQVPEVREDKVAEVRGQIADGSFQVNAELIADKLLAGGL